MNKETCRHGLSMNEHHCALCMHEGKGARPTVIKDCQAYPSAEKEAESLRQQLAEEQEAWARVLKAANAQIADLTAQLAQYQQAEPVGTPSSQWKAAGEADPHGDRYNCERAELAMGTLTDDELANGAYLNYDRRPHPQEIIDGKASSPIAWMTAVKDRIRWLSRKLEEASTPQPAAVAVVLPEEMRELGFGEQESTYGRHMYNYAIAEVRRLNAETTTVQERKERIKTVIAEALGCSAYDCTRVWSAWSYGTMRQDDFVLVAEDDARLEEIADAVIATIQASQSQGK